MPSYLGRAWISLLGCVALGVVTTGTASATSPALQAITAASPAVGAQLQPYDALLTVPTSITTPLPADPVNALITAVSALSSAVGLPQNPAPAVNSSGISGAIAGRIANLLTAMSTCQQVSETHFAAIAPAALPAVVTTGGALNPATHADIRACAPQVWQRTVELELALDDLLASPGVAGCGIPGSADLDIWPVLRFDGNTCGDNTYPNDYLLIVDAGGNDTYRNNAGGNLVDLNFSPAGSAVPGLRGTGPARGCQRAIPGLTAADCVPAVGVLLDLQGQDTYGVKETPDHDTGCTTDLVVRRMMTGGAGFLGVSVLRDSGGSADAYTGKTGALGAGHVFGVGLLSDDAGNDTYTAVRNSQGFALVGGFGLLHDQDGADGYDYYMPAPINPSAPNQTEGAGGVRDDEGEGLCDRIPRFVQGTANVLPGSIGILIDDLGADTYHGAFAGDFIAPIQNPSTRAGSLGFGNNQGIGVFLDRATTNDTYQADNEPAVPGVPPRGNNVTLTPGNDSTSAGAGSGLFIDQ
ncbi:MAG TPA: hypothetical protein VFV67_05930 [Actinophytocola sp.]|uniref:hypothetical protein n=1 Tax=Actinophytocola sp. TaxID=1872138 RepID=UPI002DB67ABE|nr:hypothetical protein [Actinophytocola sp.]HEU5470173.1 hypothetical protein [Actinophytocola sp.]